MPTRRGADVVNSEIVLANVRVLAIDQAPKEKDGQNAVVGKTVTLELKPEQAETLARARQTGTLSLALRSIADVNTVEQVIRRRRPEAGRERQGGSLRRPEHHDDTEVIQGDAKMKCGNNQLDGCGRRRSARCRWRRSPR